MAIRAAKAAGALGVEVDLRFTADGVGVLSHDADIERATGRPGLVRAMTLAQLREIDFSATHRNRDRFPNEKVRAFRTATACQASLAAKFTATSALQLTSLRFRRWRRR